MATGRSAGGSPAWLRPDSKHKGKPNDPGICSGVSMSAANSNRSAANSNRSAANSI
jgi:hypothetical protein